MSAARFFKRLFHIKPTVVAEAKSKSAEIEEKYKPHPYDTYTLTQKIIKAINQKEQTKIILIQDRDARANAYKLLDNIVYTLEKIAEHVDIEKEEIEKMDMFLTTLRKRGHVSDRDDNALIDNLNTLLERVKSVNKDQSIRFTCG